MSFNFKKPLVRERYEDEEGVEESPSTDFPPPPKAKPLRKRSDRSQSKQIRDGLDPSILQVFPPHITDNLGWLQQDWLVFRLQTYSDRQACLAMGIKFRTLKDWLGKHKEFKTAYDLVTLDPLNFAATLNRLIMLKANVETIRLLDHPSVNIRIKMIEMANRTAATVAAAEAKRPAMSQVNIYQGLSPAEWARKVLESGMIDDPQPTGYIDIQRLVAGTTLEAIPLGETESDELSRIYDDSGRDETGDHEVRTMGMAEGFTLDLDAGEV